MHYTERNNDKNYSCVFPQKESQPEDKGANILKYQGWQEGDCGLPSLDQVNTSSKYENEFNTFAGKEL